jgi:hypothetical protein
VTALGFPNSTEVVAPLVDLTLGVFDRVDLILVASPVFSVSPDLPTDTSGVVALAAKWQFLRTEHWNASFSPAGVFNSPVIGDSNVILPVELEYSRESFAVGINGSYVVDFDRSDLWYMSLYVGLGATDSLELLAEIWGGRGTPDERSALGVNLGLDWEMQRGLHLLAAGGPGVGWQSGRHVQWYAFLGLQWQFALWSRD